MTTPLSPRDHAVLAYVSLCGQLTSQQITRLAYSDPSTSPALRQLRASRRLKQLHKQGHLSRHDRSVGGHVGGSSGYVYQPAGSRANNVDLHALDIAEIFVQLKEAEALGLCEVVEFSPEDTSRRGVKPDAYIRLIVAGELVEYFVEVDRGTEWKPRLRQKLGYYSRAYKQEHDFFPLVVWLVSFAPMMNLDKRVGEIRDLVRLEDEPALFQVCRLDEAVKVFLQ